MKKTVFTFLVFMTALQIVAKPAIRFKSTTIDFGEVESGQIVDISFEFENSGSDLLIIKNIIPACGCTTATPSKREYKAGEKGVIASKFNSSGYNGRVVKTITVVSNDPDGAETRLTISGTITNKDFAQADLKPDRLNFETVTVGKTYTRKLNLSNSGSAELRIIEIICGPEVSLIFKTNVLGAKKTSEITVNFTPFARGNFNTIAKIRTNDSRTPYLFIRLEAQCE